MKFSTISAEDGKHGRYWLAEYRFKGRLLLAECTTFSEAMNNLAALIDDQFDRTEAA